MSFRYGGIEAGGTKFVCAVGTGPGDLHHEERFPTTTPEETLGRCLNYFRRRAAAGDHIDALGIASFGPVDPNPESAKFGYITSTPKPGWKNTDFVGPLKKELQIPVAFDTDVNVAAFGEQAWGAAQGLNTFIYLTIGTGIGGGGLVNGKLMHGLIHPEMGHIRVPHDLQEDPFPGRCPYHGDCLEGLACGPAIEERWQKPGRELGEDHPAWDLEAKYLGYAVVNFICTLSPQRVILGGGVMDTPGLHEKVRGHVHRLLNGYVDSPDLLERLDHYIVSPGLGNQSGVLGAIALARAVHG